MAKYRYVAGDSHEIVTADGQTARRGTDEVVELSEEQVIDLSQRGIILEPADGRSKMPEPEIPTRAYISALKRRNAALEQEARSRERLKAQADAMRAELKETVAETPAVEKAVEKAAASASS